MDDFGIDEQAVPDAPEIDKRLAMMKKMR